jgi:hypothetical protein
MCEAATDDHRRLIEIPGLRRTAMPYENENERVADVDGESLLCWESEGILLPETTIDLHTGSFETLSLSLVDWRIEV